MKKIAVIGSGVVGEASGRGFMSKGNDVTFIDVSEKRVNELKALGYKAYLSDEAINANLDIDINFFSVPTPTVNDHINLDFLKNAVSDFAKRLAKSNKYQVLVIRSTVLPGTTRSLITLIEEISGKRAGEDFGICMNPEYLREISAYEDFVKPWIIVIGQYDEKSGQQLEDLYQNFDAPIYKMNLEEAELQKYIHNLYNAVKISFFNEFFQIGKNMDMDTKKVMETVVKSSEGIWNHAYGTKDKGPYGRSCLPKDTKALSTWAKEKGYETDVLNAAIDVNEKLLSKIAQDKNNFMEWANNNGLDKKTLTEIVGGNTKILESLSL
jgi:UDPglucose 6-dehydrogenase